MSCRQIGTPAPTTAERTVFAANGTLRPFTPRPRRQAVGLDTQLTPASAPGYTMPEKPKPKEDTTLAPQFPWWFGFGVVSSLRGGVRGALGAVQQP